MFAPGGRQGLQLSMSSRHGQGGGQYGPRRCGAGGTGRPALDLG